MPADTFPQTAPELNTARKRPAPVVHDAVTGFSGRVISEGAPPTETTQLMAIAAAHIIPCPFCIRGHIKIALRHGATAQEIMEAIWVAVQLKDDDNKTERA